ncbi:hypothetical protein ZWY2020_058380 [Hordeum vulgare]|nr:hypothetical protein ZWY2020_058380 [Hordeum vulgare]
MNGFTSSFDDDAHRTPTPARRTGTTASPTGSGRGRRGNGDFLRPSPLEMIAARICTLVHRAIKHYNSKNKGAEFGYPDQSTTEMKAACVGFRETFWYHLSFSARPRDGSTEKQHFFAELYFSRHSRQLAVQTCIILEKPMCQLSNGCAFCPHESNILHPSKAEFVCGKEGHEKEFFHVRDMLMRPFISCVELLYRNDLQ